MSRFLVKGEGNGKSSSQSTEAGLKKMKKFGRKYILMVCHSSFSCNLITKPSQAEDNYYSLLQDCKIDICDFNNSNKTYSISLNERERRPGNISPRSVQKRPNAIIFNYVPEQARLISS